MCVSDLRRWVVSPASETINGETTYLLSTQTEFVEILDTMSGGWIVVGND